MTVLNYFRNQRKPKNPNYVHVHCHNGVTAVTVENVNLMLQHGVVFMLNDTYYAYDGKSAWYIKGYALTGGFVIEPTRKALTL